MSAVTRKRIYRRAPRPMARDACPACFRPVAITPTGRRRKHQDSEGRECTGSGITVGTLAVTAEVLSAATITFPARRQPGLCTGVCRECARPIGPDRRYCGPCLSRRKL